MVYRPIFLSALNIVKKVLAADYGCERTDFENEGVFIHRYAKYEGARRFLIPSKTFTVVTMGRGVVVSCSLERLGWADAHLSQVSRNDIFAPPTLDLINRYIKPDNQVMSEPTLKYICTDEIFRPVIAGADVEITLVEGQALLDLYQDKRFTNSLGPYPTSQLPMAVAAVARYQGKIAGIAAVCDESDSLWQVGVDTLPEFENRGIGKSTVSAVTQYVLDKGIVPYYSTTESNTASRSVASGLGYKTAWIEMYCKDIKA
jgi:GNAT superfamily N-acetyltransferase